MPDPRARYSTPPPGPLPEAERGSRGASSPSPLRGGGRGEGLACSPSPLRGGGRGEGCLHTLSVLEYEVGRLLPRLDRHLEGRLLLRAIRLRKFDALDALLSLLH